MQSHKVQACTQICIYIYVQPIFTYIYIYFLGWNTCTHLINWTHSCSADGTRHAIDHDVLYVQDRMQPRISNLVSQLASKVLRAQHKCNDKFSHSPQVSTMVGHNFTQHLQTMPYSIFALLALFLTDRLDKNLSDGGALPQLRGSCEAIPVSPGRSTK